MGTKALVINLRDEYRSFAFDITNLTEEQVLPLKYFLQERMKKNVEVVLVFGLENYGEYKVDTLYESEKKFMNRVYDEALI